MTARPLATMAELQGTHSKRAVSLEPNLMRRADSTIWAQSGSLFSRVVNPSRSCNATSAKTGTIMVLEVPQLHELTGFDSGSSHDGDQGVRWLGEDPSNMV